MTVDSAWFVYMVRTADGYLYTGVTTNVQRRFAEHQAAAGQTVIVGSKTESQARPIARSKGAKYFRGKRGLQLVFEKTVADRSTAQKLEYKIKRLGKRDKEALAAGKLSITNLVAEIND